VGFQDRFVQETAGIVAEKKLIVAVINFDGY